jgi:ABC-type protease/lipase transport system fused ATPase/permease subunit
MVDFSIINNEKLRELVMASKSIMSLPENDLQTMVERISQMPPEGENAFMEALQKDAAPPEKIGLLQRSIEKLKQIKKKLTGGILKIKEKSEEKIDQTAADNLLKNI